MGLSLDMKKEKKKKLIATTPKVLIYEKGKSNLVTRKPSQSSLKCHVHKAKLENQTSNVPSGTSINPS